MVRFSSAGLESRSVNRYSGAMKILVGWFAISFTALAMTVSNDMWRERAGIWSIAVPA